MVNSRLVNAARLACLLSALFQLSLVSALARDISTPLVSICVIQGNGEVSPRQGDYLRVQGVVFADLDDTSKKGFFMQTEACDGDSATSDGIFVYLGVKGNAVAVGDKVEVTGWVEEYNGQTEIDAAPQDVEILSSGNALPLPSDMNPPFENTAAQSYLESLEGMYVKLDEALVVGPTNDRGESWVMRADLGLARVYQDDPNGTGEVFCVDDGGLFEIAGDAKVGDHLQGLLGFWEYTYDLYRLNLLAQPTLISATTTFTPPASSPGFSIVTFNVENLFDTFDDPNTEDPVLNATEYQRHLNKLALAISDALNLPTLIALQEIENQMVLDDLLARPELLADYGAVWLDGPDRRGIDVALLYREDRANILDFEQRQGCTTLVDGLGPDGNNDVNNPQNTLTCDRDGDGTLDGNRLFSRPPLIISLEVCVLNEREACRQWVNLWLVLNHWKSKSEDTFEVKYTLPRRLEEAQFIADLTLELESNHPTENLMVLGDLNDYPNSQPLAILSAVGLTSLMPRLPSAERFTYIYQGISQALDHILVNAPLREWLVFPFAAHFNADYPDAFFGQSGTFYRSSDHDPLLARFVPADSKAYLPFINRR
jgi:predicted extracellular nuclease